MTFFDFLGHYWWLVFPLMGVGGAVLGRWDQLSRRRHERKLEMLRMKGELRGARAAASAPPPAVEEDESDAARIARLTTAHDAVTHRWLEYELDVSKLIAYPAMSDGRQPLTAAFLRAKKVADSLRPESAKEHLTPRGIAEYRDAVTDYEVAFDVAERDAKRLRDSSFTDAERKRLDTAKQLLTVAIDQAATPAERQLAYRRVREELDGLLSISDEAIDELEKKVALELPSRAAAADAAAGGPSASAAAAGVPAGSASVAAAAAREARPVAPPPPPGAATAPGRVVRPKPPR
ncbi:hypothetical protein ACIQLJ_02765 [Microbacterium sp. NPDC091313]